LKTVILNCKKYFTIFLFYCSIDQINATLHSEQITQNNAGLFEPKFGSNMDKPKCWVKNCNSKMYSWKWKL